MLVKALERHGIGRPSTYASTLATLKKRGYVALEKRKLTVTPLGEQVVGVLLKHLPNLFKVSFTAEMETALDEIALGKQNGQTYLQTFWQGVAPQFGEAVVQATVSPTVKVAKSSPSSSSVKCPKCGKPLKERTGQRGSFLGCTGYPNCRHTQSLPTP